MDDPWVSSSLVLSSGPVNEKVELKCNRNPLNFLRILSSHECHLHLHFQVVLWMRKWISSVNSCPKKPKLNHILTCTHQFKRLIGNEKKHWILKHFSFLISDSWIKLNKSYVSSQPLETLLKNWKLFFWNLWKWFYFSICTSEGSQRTPYSSIV